MFSLSQWVGPKDLIIKPATVLRLNNKVKADKIDKFD